MTRYIAILLALLIQTSVLYCKPARDKPVPDGFIQTGIYTMPELFSITLPKFAKEPIFCEKELSDNSQEVIFNDC